MMWWMKNGQNFVTCQGTVIIQVQMSLFNIFHLWKVLCVIFNGCFNTENYIASNDRVSDKWKPVRTWNEAVWPEYFPAFPSWQWRKPCQTPSQDRQHSRWNLSLVPPKHKFRSLMVSKCVWFLEDEWYPYRQKKNS